MNSDSLTVKTGFLGQGCYIRTDLGRSGLRRCQLPAWVVLELMDCGRWQLLGRDLQSANTNWRSLPLDTVLDCHWRADVEQVELAIVRLRSQTPHPFRARLARVLTQSLPDHADG